MVLLHELYIIIMKYRFSSFCTISENSTQCKYTEWSKNAQDTDKSAVLVKMTPVALTHASLIYC